MPQENNLAQPQPERDRTIVDFIEDHPTYLSWYTHLTLMAETVPDVFLSPPIDTTVDMLACFLANKEYYGAYFMGGASFMYMILAELEEQGMYEECSQIEHTLEYYGPSTEPFHDTKRKEKEGGDLP